MLPADYAAFWPSLGWLAALMLAALLPSLPGNPWRRHAGWFVAFCAACLLTAAQELVSPATAPATRAISTVAAAMLLWEFARRSWNDRSARSIPAATQWIGIEAIALIAAILAATSESARPAWFGATEQLFAALPLALGGASVWLLWQPPGTGQPSATIAFRAALVCAALHPLGSSAASLAIAGHVAPWVLALALAVICYAEPAVRTRPAIVCTIGLFFAAGLGPVIVAAILQQRAARQREDLLARAERITVPLQGGIAARLGADTPGAETVRALQQHLERTAFSDPLLRAASLWKLRDGRVATLELSSARAGFAAPRTANADEARIAQGIRPVVDPPRDGLVRVHAPLTPAMFESPAAWLTLSYPDTFWDVQRQHARRTGITLVGIFAGCCALGFVLASRQAIENAQRLQIERAQSADKAKTEFLAFLSHEMRTPLQTILGRTELLRESDGVTDAVRRHASVIETQGALLLRLVTDLLDLGTLEAGKFQLHARPFSLRAALTAVEDTVRTRAAAKQLGFTVSIAPGVPDTLIGDEARLRQILGNLLGNAAKYTERGEVALRVATGDGGEVTGANSTSASGILSPVSCRLIFSVTDTGPGLPPDRIPQLFTLFTRLDSGDTFTREGTGVGLALVRRLCELMGGSVAAANRAEGGAEFTVRLSFPVSTESMPGDAEAPSQRSHGLRVLVAEDNAAAREFLVEALQALGHRAESVGNGEAALSAAATQPFDAVLLDVNLPGRDGVSIAQILARQPDRPRLIGCSAEAFAHTREAALAAGMDAFLEKPVTVKSLAAALAVPTPQPESASLFERLRSPELIRQTRAALARELPAIVARLRAAHANRDAAAVQRDAHALHSTALLADDAAIAELCRRLEREAAAGTNGEADAILRELARHAAQPTA